GTLALAGPEHAENLPVTRRCWKRLPCRGQSRLGSSVAGDARMVRRDSHGPRNTTRSRWAGYIPVRNMVSHTESLFSRVPDLAAIAAKEEMENGFAIDVGSATVSAAAIGVSPMACGARFLLPSLRLSSARSGRRDADQCARDARAP